MAQLEAGQEAQTQTGPGGQGEHWLTRFTEISNLPLSVYT